MGVSTLVRPAPRAPGQERAIHLVDLENLLGDPWARGRCVGRAVVRYAQVAGWQPGDLVVVAANPWMVYEMGPQRPIECSVHTARGPDGADHLLLDAAPPEFVVRRASRLVVGSGDGIFAERVERVRGLGVEVVVVARRGTVSWRLRRLGVPVVPFDPDDDDPQALAA